MKLISRIQKSVLKREGPVLYKPAQLLFKTHNKISVKKAHFQRWCMRRCLVHNCSGCNGEVLQHLGLPHVPRGFCSCHQTPHHTPASFSFIFTKPFLSSLSRYLKRDRLLRDGRREETELNKQTQSSVEQCLIESHMAPVSSSQKLFKNDQHSRVSTPLLLYPRAQSPLQVGTYFMF